VLFAWNDGLAKELGLDDLGDTAQKAAYFSGNARLPGAQPISLAYAGHQFGNFVPQLGDGRAVLLGEVVSAADGQRYDLQLKGSGQTPFSRRGDGKSSLGPVIREYLVSEAMHRLGVPTTRALAAVTTGETVLRESRLPGGVLTRVAASHIRVGTFEYFAARRDAEAITLLLEHAVARHYPEIADADSLAPAFLGRVVERQAGLVAQWMALGFIHGVMNTDNTAVSGQTIDYGPCAFLDTFEVDKVFSSIDQFGRYAYDQQASIAQWNLARLADSLLLLGGEQDDFETELEQFSDLFQRHYLDLMRRKLGLNGAEADDWGLVTAWLQHLQDNALDYTQSYRDLAAALEGQGRGRGSFGEFEQRWHKRIADDGVSAAQRRVLMDAVNPLYIPRNHLVERAIDAAIAGDFGVFETLHEVLSQPFSAQPDKAAFAAPPAPHEVVEMTFCGT
jgi:uncharacterized protein YdiU (UPF0061 family)